MTKIQLLVAAGCMAAVVTAFAPAAFADPNGGGSGGSSDPCQSAQEAAGALNIMATTEEQAAGLDPLNAGTHLAIATGFRVQAQLIVDDACGTAPQVVSAGGSTGQETIGTPGAANCVGQTTSSLAQLGGIFGSPGIGGLAQLTGLSVNQIRDAVAAFCDS